MNQKYLILYPKGDIHGIADLVPGVSGGTIALVVGIYYEELISTQFKPIATTAHTTAIHLGLEKFLDGHQWEFFTGVFGGIITSIIAFLTS